LGFYFLAQVFVSSGGAALCFWAFTLKSNPLQKPKNNVLQVG